MKNDPHFPVRKKLFFVCLLTCCLLLAGCRAEKTEARPFYGSFTDEKTYSFDGRYYALETVERMEEANVKVIRVTVYETATDEPAASFVPARAMDFWGICWERDSYNLWTQSSDIGISCYEYREGTWTLNESLRLPDYIVTRDDKAYRDHPELWDAMYTSPTERKKP